MSCNWFCARYAYAAKSKSWHTLHPAARPYATAFASMQYSAEEDRVILFGGQHQGGTKTNELWEFILQESRWVKATVSGGPTLRRGASLAEMPQGFLLFGGKRLGCTGRSSNVWALNLTKPFMSFGTGFPEPPKKERRLHLR